MLDNVGTLVLFRQGPGAGLRDLVDILWPRFRERDLQTLPDFHAIVKTIGSGGRPITGRLTIDPPEERQRNGRGSGPGVLRRGALSAAPSGREASDTGGALHAIRAASRRAIARPRAEVEAELLARITVRDE